MTIEIVKNPKGVAADDTDEKAKCAEFKERLESIRALIADARARLDEEFSVSALEKRCDDIDGKLAELKTSREEVIESYGNGEIGAEDFIKAAKDLDKQMEDLSHECWRVRNDICMKKACRHDREKPLIEIEKILNEIDAVENHPELYCVFADYMSFDNVETVINGTASQEQTYQIIGSLREPLEVARIVIHRICTTIH